MDRNDFIEKYLGGVFAAIAVLAAILEMIFNGISTDTILSCIKDIAGTAVVIILWISLILSRPRKPKNVEELLEKDVEKWGLNNAPLIFKAEDFQGASGTNYTQGFVLLQDPTKYPALVGINPESVEWHRLAKAGKENRTTGKFLSFPSYKVMASEDFKITVTMGQSHFKNKENINDIYKDIVGAINNRYRETISIKPIPSSFEIEMTYKSIQTKMDIENFVNSIDFVLSLVKVVA